MKREGNLYKLTDQAGYTRKGRSNECLWGENVTHIASGTGRQDLCTDSYIHAYTSPEITALMNPAHANITNPILWLAKGFIRKTNGQLKCGCYSLTTIRQIELPKYTNTQRVYFGILCALEVYKESSFVKWATEWIDGTDRTKQAAAYAEDAAYAATAAAAAYANAAAYAAAGTAAGAAAAAAKAYAAATKPINFIKLARKALAFEAETSQKTTLNLSRDAF